MNIGYKVIFCLFLVIAAIYDWKQQKIPIWLFGISLIAALGRVVWGRDREMLEILSGFGIGIGMLILSKIVKGAIGVGDGIFFCISGILLGGKKNLLLLMGGVFVCGMYSIFLLLFGVLVNVSVRKWRLPFLTFLLPVGIGVVLL